MDEMTSMNFKRSATSINSKKNKIYDTSNNSQLSIRRPAKLNLLKCVDNKFSYQTIEELAISVEETQKFILRSFSENDNNIPFVVLHKLLSKSFDVSFMKKIFRTKSKDFPKFLLELRDQKSADYFCKLLSNDLKKDFLGNFLHKGCIDTQFWICFHQSSDYHWLSNKAHATYLSSTSSLEIALKLFLKSFDRKFVILTLNCKNSDNFTFLRLCALPKEKHNFLSIFKLLCDNLTELELRALFLGEYNKSILRIFCEHNIDIDVLEILKVMKNINVDFLKDCMSGENNFIRIFCSSNKKFHIGKYLEFFVNTFDIEFVKEFLIAKDETESSILYDLCDRNDNDFEDACRSILKYLGNEFLRTLLVISAKFQTTVAHTVASRSDSDKKFMSFIKFLKDEYGINYVLEILNAKNYARASVILIACRKQENFVKFLHFLVKEFGAKEVKKLLLSKAESSESLIYNQSRILSHDAFMETLQVILEYYDVEFLKKLLTSCGAHKSNGTLLNNFVACRPTTDFAEIYVWIRKTLGFNFLRMNIESKKTVQLILTVCLHSTRTSIMKIMRYLVEDFGLEFVKKLLIMKDGSSDSILHNLSRNGHIFDLPEFLEFWISNTDTEVARQILTFSHIYGTVLHCLCKNHQNKPEILVIMRLFVKHYGKDLLREILEIRVVRNTCLHVLVINHMSVNFVEYYEYFKSEFDSDFMREVIPPKTYDNSTVLHFLSKYSQETTFVELFRLMTKDFDLFSIKKLLNDLNREGNSVMHLLGKYNDKVKFNDLFYVLKEAYEV